MEKTLDEARRRPDANEINAMPLRHYDGEVRVVRRPEELRAASQDLRRAKVLGFDTETRPSFKKGKKNAPALIQLATDSLVYLIQLSWLPFGEECASLLADPAIVKVGVGIGDDMRSLAGIYPFEPAGLVDLGEMASVNNFQSRGLRTLAASLFGWRISKGSQCSNWSLRDLSPKQIAYAATDAWISRAIYSRLLELGAARPEGAP